MLPLRSYCGYVERESMTTRKSFYQRVRALAQQGLDLFFPPRCAGCQRCGSLLCQDCLSTMQPLIPPFCRDCGTPLRSFTECCDFCLHMPGALCRLRSVNLYRGALRRAIHALKYHGQQRLADPLGLLLVRAFVSYNLRADAIIPLPLHQHRQQQRGYNQAVLLARVCAAHLELPCLEHLVIRQRATREQVGLSVHERQQNVSGAFVLTPGAKTRLLSYRRVVIIDDVSTTGATLQACSTPLYAVGIQEICGLVLARPVHLIRDTSKGVL